MEIATSPGGVRSCVQVQPRARRDAVKGEYADSLKMHLSAPPVTDRANEALAQLLAERLKASRAAVRIINGEKNRRKQVFVIGLKREQVLGLLAAAKGPAKEPKD